MPHPQTRLSGQLQHALPFFSTCFAKPLYLFFLGVVDSIVLFSHRCRLGQLVHYKLSMFCRTFTALRLPLVFSSSVLQMDGEIPYWTELLYIQFSVQSVMGGDAIKYTSVHASRLSAQFFLTKIMVHIPLFEHVMHAKSFATNAWIFHTRHSMSIY